MDAKMARRQPASADENLRDKAADKPTVIFATRAGRFGWHPVALPVAA